MTPRVSIIIGNYNYGRFIEEAIRSVLDQDYAQLELIIVDDGSTDGSRTIIERLEASSGGRLRALFQENAGVAAARNAGIEMARGEYIGFLDADDVYLKDCVSSLTAYLDKNPAVAMVYANSELFDSALSRSLGLWFSRETGHEPCWGHFIGELFFRGNFIPIHPALLRRKALDKAGYFNKFYRVGEDWELWFRMTEHHDVRYLDRILSKIRRHPGNISASPLNALIKLWILRKIMRSNPWLADRFSQPVMDRYLSYSYYELGRAMILSGGRRRRRGRMYLWRSFLIRRRMPKSKWLLYLALSYIPWTGFVTGLRRLWRSAFPQSGTAKRAMPC